MLMLSIIIPLYNQTNTILRAVESIVHQMEDGDELIIVDDGSTDADVSALLKDFFALRDIVLIKQENLGVSAARNAGVLHAKYEYLVFLDADDWWLPGRRKYLEELILRWPDANAWTVAHKRVGLATTRDIDPGVSCDTQMTSCGFIMHYSRFTGAINSSVVCIKKSVFWKVGGFPAGETAGEDIFMWLQLGLYGSIVIGSKALVCIERPEVISAKCKKRDPIGYHYKFFSDSKVLQSLSIDKREAVKKFLIKNGLRQIAGCVIANDRGAGWLKARVISRVAPLMLIMALVILSMPRWFWLLIHSSLAFRNHRRM